ncbi:MAG: hypothetical protein R3Y24_09090 [Eubacteriales bacterium]
MKLLFAYSQAFLKKDKEAVEQLNSRYEIKKDVVYMIAKVTDAISLFNKLKVKEREENMCEYLQEIWNDGLSIGEARGAHGMVKIMKSFCVPPEEMIGRLMEELKLERVEAEKYVQG